MAHAVDHMGVPAAVARSCVWGLADRRWIPARIDIGQEGKRCACRTTTAISDAERNDRPALTESARICKTWWDYPVPPHINIAVVHSVADWSKPIREPHDNVSELRLNDAIP